MTIVDEGEEDHDAVVEGMMMLNGGESHDGGAEGDTYCQRGFSAFPSV